MELFHYDSATPVVDTATVMRGGIYQTWLGKTQFLVFTAIIGAAVSDSKYRREWLLSKLVWKDSCLHMVNGSMICYTGHMNINWIKTAKKFFFNV